MSSSRFFGFRSQLQSPLGIAIGSQNPKTSTTQIPKKSRLLPDVPNQETKAGFPKTENVRRLFISKAETDDVDEADMSSDEHNIA